MLCVKELCTYMDKEALLGPGSFLYGFFRKSTGTFSVCIPSSLARSETFRWLLVKLKLEDDIRMTMNTMTNFPETVETTNLFTLALVWAHKRPVCSHVTWWLLDSTKCLTTICVPAVSKTRPFPACSRRAVHGRRPGTELMLSQLWYIHGLPSRQ